MLPLIKGWLVKFNDYRRPRGGGCCLLVMIFIAIDCTNGDRIENGFFHCGGIRTTAAAACRLNPMERAIILIEWPCPVITYADCAGGSVVRH